MTEPSNASRRTFIAGAVAAVATAACACVGRVAADGAGSIEVIGNIPNIPVQQFGALKPAARLAQSGRLLFPMSTSPKCTVLSNFGEARSGGRSHEGIDLLSSLGQEVYAVADGRLTVQYVDGAADATLAGNAWGLQADVGGDYFLFAHLSSFAPGLTKGSTVRRGQVIGYVGDTGNPAPGSYHLHFEVHLGGQQKAAVDPLPLLEVPKACTIF